jgi:hypothetical protein
MSCHLWGQSISFTATPSQNTIGTRDAVRVTYTINNVNNLTDLRPSSLGDFELIQNPDSYRSSTNINGVQTTSISVNYLLHPKHEGALTIPPAIAKDASGHTYQSNAVMIQVVPGTLAPQRRTAPARDPFGDDDDIMAMMQQMQRMNQQMNAQMNRMQQMQRQQPPQPQPNPQPQPVNNDEIKKDLFIKVIVDKSKVHVGEQITTSYKLYSRLPMQVSISKLPSLNGFWTQDFEIPKQAKPTEETIDGKKYQVFLLKKSALFPQQTGELELDPAEAKGVARIVQQVRRKMSDLFGAGTLMMNDPFFNNAYYDAMGYRDVNVDLQSTPVKIKVLPLPEKGKPDNYGGAVGQFTISDKIDKRELTTDDIATLTLNITGSGNLKLIEAPKFTLPNGISMYDPQIVDTITGRTNTISGTKSITYAITPHTPGDYEIPGADFTYFNPQTGAYVTEHTQPLQLHVKPGRNYHPVTATDNTVALKDLHDIVKQSVSELRPGGKPYLLTAPYWSMYALPLLAFIGIIGWKKKDEEQSGNTVLQRSKRANKIALSRLTTAKKLLDQGNKTPFYEEISKAIWLYLSNKMNIPLSSLSRDTARHAMNDRKIPDHLQKNVENVMWECETALYASGGSKEMNNTYHEAVKVITDLEEAFKA